MPRTIVESVPSSSGGRDPAKADFIAAATGFVPGIAIAGREMDADHDAAGMAFAASAEAAGEAAPRGAEGDPAKPDFIAAAIGSVQCIAISGREMDADYDAGGMAFAGSAGAVGEAAPRGAEMSPLR